jgi:hypothetical protein
MAWIASAYYSRINAMMYWLPDWKQEETGEVLSILY